MAKREKKIGVYYISLEAVTPPMIEMVLKTGDYHKNTTAWLFINQSLGQNEDHIIKPMHYPVIALKAQITEVELSHLMDSLVKYNPEYFNYELWTKYQILRIDKVVDHYTATVYTKNDRTNKPATIEELKLKLSPTVNETVNVSSNSNSNSNSKGSEGKREGSDGNLPTPCGNREGYDFVPNNKELAFYDRKEEMEFKANLLKVQSEIGRELNYNEKLVLLDNIRKQLI